MANNRFKVDNGLVVTGNAEFYQRIDSFANAHFRNDLFVVSGNLVVNGTIVYANVVVGNGGIRSIADQQDLGNTTNRFNLFGYRVQIDDTLVPLANGVAVGNTTRRFEVFANNLNATTITIGAGGSINATYFSGTASNANTVGNLDANGIIVRTGTSTAAARSVNVSSNGITITNGDGTAGNPTLALAFGAGMFANTTGMFVNLSSVSVGTLPITRGGTGGPDRASGLNNLLPTQNVAVVDYVLRTDGTNASWVQAVGPTGFTGSRGFTGSVGIQGVTGFTGSAGTNGNNGFTGSVGAQGFTGSAGAQGGTGFTGSAGTNGSLGFTGSAGIGTTGFTGSIGGLGYTGSGGIGFTGSRGFTGSGGFTGSAGTNGNVGFTGSAGPVAGSSTTVQFNDGGFANGSSNFTYTKSTAFLYVNGDVQAADFVVASDDTLKDVIGNIPNALDIINSLDGVRYTWNELGQQLLGYRGDKIELGVLAQQVEKELPELIAMSNNGDYKMVAYARLTAVLIEAVKELSAKVDALENQ